MSTMNISITDDQAKLVDKLTQEYDFANHSEFFRAILRLISQKPTVLRDTAPVEFVEFKKRPLEEIEEKMMATGKYSKRFVRSIIEGLKESSVYANS